jgi:hypothetical protein
MKTAVLIAFILIFIVCIFSCGQSDTDKVQLLPYGFNKVLWSGTPSKDETAKSIFEETKTCMTDFGYSRTGSPYIIVVDQPFYCTPGALCEGCLHDYQVIYIAKSADAGEPIYVSGIPIYTPTLRHEFIHWITLKGDADHGTDYLQKCIQ